MEPGHDDAVLVERARSGDLDAFGALVRRHEDVAFRVAYAITGNAADAEDAAQSAFTRAFRALDRFRPEAPLRPWLLAIVANEARNRARSERRQRRLFPRSAASEPRLTASSSEDLALRGETQREVWAALGRLRDEERLALVVRYVLDLSEADAAAVLGCAPGTVKSRLSRGLERLRAELEGAA